MKKIIALLSAACLLLSFAACGQSETPENTTAATTVQTTVTTPEQTTKAQDPETTGPETEPEDVDVYIVHGTPVVDGEKDEVWNTAQEVILEQIKTGSETDTVVKASAMWDENGFYFFFDITDAAICQDSTIGDWKNDSLYLYVGEDMSYAEFVTSNADFTSGLFQFALISDDLELVPRYGDEVEYETEYMITETGMTIEFFYRPTDETRSNTLTADHLIYLDYQYNDCTSGAVRDCAFGYYNASDTNFEPLRWAYAKLLAPGTPVPEIAAE